MTGLGESSHLALVQSPTASQATSHSAPGVGCVRVQGVTEIQKPLYPPVGVSV